MGLLLLKIFKILNLVEVWKIHFSIAERKSLICKNLILNLGYSNKFYFFVCFIFNFIIKLFLLLQTTLEINILLKLGFF